jgi:organic radical activating enzyme
MHLKVKEIFYSIQGEGGRAGEASIFIRLAECNLNCWFCDTDWSIGTDMTIAQIKNVIKDHPTEWIVWTGGEPTLQLTNEVLTQFPEYKHAIETNGTNPVPTMINYITVSPKKEVSIETLQANFPERLGPGTCVDEFRYPYGTGESLPPYYGVLPTASYYFISPLFMGEKKKRFQMDDINVIMCVDFVLKNPKWRLSLQTHKIINIR